jgi:hypothetical protein
VVEVIPSDKNKAKVKHDAVDGYVRVNILRVIVCVGSSI